MKTKQIRKNDVFSVDMGGGKTQCMVLQNISPTLTCTHYGEPVVCYEQAEDIDDSDKH